MCAAPRNLSKIMEQLEKAAQILMVSEPYIVFIILSCKVYIVRVRKSGL